MVETMVEMTVFVVFVEVETVVKVVLVVEIVDLVVVPHWLVVRLVAIVRRLVACHQDRRDDDQQVLDRVEVLVVVERRHRRSRCTGSWTSRRSRSSLAQ